MTDTERLPDENRATYVSYTCEEGYRTKFETRPSLLERETRNWRRAHEGMHKSRGEPMCDQFRVELLEWSDYRYGAFPPD